MRKGTSYSRDLRAKILAFEQSSERARKTKAAPVLRMTAIDGWEGGGEDWPHAYRTCPMADDQALGCVVAFWHEDWVEPAYQVYSGLLRSPLWSPPCSDLVQSLQSVRRGSRVTLAMATGFPLLRRQPRDRLGVFKGLITLNGVRIGSVSAADFGTLTMWPRSWH